MDMSPEDLMKFEADSVYGASAYKRAKRGEEAAKQAVRTSRLG
jgi:hypothetical protein